MEHGMPQGMAGPQGPGQTRRVAADPNDRRTVFLMNLPEDCSLREVRNMFTFAPGFLKAQLYNSKPTDGQEEKLGAFVLFETAAQAAQIAASLRYFQFDSEKPEIQLDSRLAVKNLHFTRTDMEARSSKRMKLEPEQPVYGQQAGAQEAYPAYAQQAQYDPYQNQQQYYQPAAAMYQPQMTAEQYNPYNPAGAYRAPLGPLKDNPPIATLYLSDLSHVDDTTLITVLSTQCSGYKDHKLSTDKKGSKVAWVAFESVELATAAKDTLASQHGIQAAYSRNALNKRSR